MLALAGVWISLASLLLATAMWLYRPCFTDWTVTLVLYFGVPGALCLSFLVLWAHRKEGFTDPGVTAQRLQAKIAVALALPAAVIVYLLVIFAEPVQRFAP